MNQDGRLTIAHLALVKQLLAEGFSRADFVPFCNWFMTENQSMGDIESQSAKNIMQAIELDKPMLVVAGGLHTKFESFTIPEGYHDRHGIFHKFHGAGEIQHTLGKIIKENYPGVSTSQIHYANATELDTNFRANIKTSTIIVDSDKASNLVIHTSNTAQNHELCLLSFVR